MKAFFTVIFLSVMVCGFSQSSTPEALALQEWLPSSIGEYALDGEPVASTMVSEQKPYSMSYKNYRKEASSLTVILFDYKNNPAMMKKATASWSKPSLQVDNELQKVGTTEVEGFKAWESIDKKENSSQLYVNIYDRYLLYLAVEGNTTEFLKNAVKSMKPRELPQ